jgi:hypothetical protein
LVAIVHEGNWTKDLYPSITGHWLVFAERQVMARSLPDTDLDRLPLAVDMRLA